MCTCTYALTILGFLCIEDFPVSLKTHLATNKSDLFALFVEHGKDIEKVAQVAILHSACICTSASPVDDVALAAHDVAIVVALLYRAT
jgi:hypothetical protein